MKHIRITLAVLALLLQAGISHAQAPVQFPASFKLDPALLPGYGLLQVTAEVRKEGILTNPGTSTEEGMKRNVCRSCDPGATSSVYYEIYQSKKNKHDDAGIMVLAFTSENELQASLDKLEGQSNYTYMVAGRYLINIWSDDSRMREKHLASIVAYYRQKLNAQEYKAREQDVTETETDAATTVTTAEEAAVDVVADVAEAQAAAVDIAGGTEEARAAEDTPTRDIPMKAGRKLKYLYYANGGLLGFFDDGTVSGCPRCDLCRENINALKKKAPHEQYEVSGDMIIMGDTSGDPNAAMDAAGLKLHHNEETSEWAIIDFKEIVSIGSCR